MGNQVPKDLPPMSPSDDLRTPARKPLRSSNPKTQYLILYNFVSAVLWTVVLGRVLLLVPLVGFGRVYAGVGQFTKWTQTLALLEVVHAAVGTYIFKLSSPHLPSPSKEQPPVVPKKETRRMIQRKEKAQAKKNPPRSRFKLTRSWDAPHIIQRTNQAIYI